MPHLLLKPLHALVDLTLGLSDLCRADCLILDKYEIGQLSVEMDPQIVQLFGILNLESAPTWGPPAIPGPVIGPQQRMAP